MEIKIKEYKWIIAILFIIFLINYLDKNTEIFYNLPELNEIKTSGIKVDGNKIVPLTKLNEEDMRIQSVSGCICHDGK